MCKCGTGRSRAFWQEDGGAVDFALGSRIYLSLDGRLFPTHALPDGIAGSSFVGALGYACKVPVLPGQSICRSVRFLPSSTECQNASSQPETANKGMNCRVHPKMSHQNVAGVSPNYFSLNVMIMFTPLFQSTFLCYSTHCTQRTWSAPPHVC